MSRFSDQVAIVTGGGSGIGRATCLRLCSEGARVAAVDVNLATAEQTATEVRGAGGTAMALACDVSDPGSVAAAVAAVARDLGAPSVLCNVAGIQEYGHAEHLSFATWSRIIGVNLTGTFLMSQATLPHLVRTRGSIVNVASLAGIMGLPYDAAYCASKGGVVMLTRALAKEFSNRGVRVNAVAPGGVETPMAEIPFPADAAPEVMQLIPRTPMGWSTPAEIAAVIAFLASEDARKVTGVVVPVDGGMTA
ncbi:MAG: 3-oxoacyl-ACP reductase [Deltaproteobacteria bacterium]|nr:3-oxoacyl-ACP reductase [Deltaproteobacteria bacterium]